MNARRAARRAGFTLIEMLLVVAIIGILAAVGMAKFGKSTEKAKINAARTEIANMKTAISRYEIDCGSYPGTLQALITSPGAKDWTGPYWEGDFKDPWDQDYTYTVGENTFEIKSAGPPGGKEISSKNL